MTFEVKLQSQPAIKEELFGPSIHSAQARAYQLLVADEPDLEKIAGVLSACGKVKTVAQLTQLFLRRFNELTGELFAHLDQRENYGPFYRGGIILGAFETQALFDAYDIDRVDLSAKLPLCIEGVLMQCNGEGLLDEEAREFKQRLSQISKEVIRASRCHDRAKQSVVSTTRMQVYAALINRVADNLVKHDMNGFSPESWRYTVYDSLQYAILSKLDQVSRARALRIFSKTSHKANKR